MDFLVAIARAFGGAALVRRVWAVGEGLVYMSDGREFEKRQAGKEALEPIGFPASDVFKYYELFLKGNRKPDWNKLERWRPRERGLK